MFISNSGGSSLLNNICGKNNGANIGSNGNCWLGLFTTMPDANGQNGVEVQKSPIKTNYSRININEIMDTTYQSYSLAENAPTLHYKRIGNALGINFNPNVDPDDPDDPTNAVDWGTIVGFGLFSAKTDGTLYAWAEFDSSVFVSVGYSFHFLEGRFEIYIDENGNAQLSANPSI